MKEVKSNEKFKRKRNNISSTSSNNYNSIDISRDNNSEVLEEIMDYFQESKKQ